MRKSSLIIEGLYESKGAKGFKFSLTCNGTPESVDDSFNTDSMLEDLAGADWNNEAEILKIVSNSRKYKNSTKLEPGAKSASFRRYVYTDNSGNRHTLTVTPK